jgi:putative endonuclease
MFNLLQNKKISIGQLGEQAAVKFLKNSGYQIICTNFTNTSGRRLGEIDIIAKEGSELVFVEVKTRVISPFQEIITPEENINYQKLRKLQKIATYYIKINNLWELSYRFDGISVIYNKENKTSEIKHLKSIFL